MPPPDDLPNPLGDADAPRFLLSDLFLGQFPLLHQQAHYLGDEQGVALGLGVFDIIEHLEGLGYTVDAHDPLADKGEAARVYGVNPLGTLDGASGYDCVIGAVAHGAYRDLGADALAGLLKPGGLLADIKGIWRGRPLPGGITLWRL